MCAVVMQQLVPSHLRWLLCVIAAACMVCATLFVMAVYQGPLPPPLLLPLSPTPGWYGALLLCAFFIAGTLGYDTYVKTAKGAGGGGEGKGGGGKGEEQARITLFKKYADNNAGNPPSDRDDKGLAPGKFPPDCGISEADQALLRASRWSQPVYTSKFSASAGSAPSGYYRNSKATGAATISHVAERLRLGYLKRAANQSASPIPIDKFPVQYIILEEDPENKRGGGGVNNAMGERYALIVNTRSGMALYLASVPRVEWKWVRADDMRDNIIKRLKDNNLLPSSRQPSETGPPGLDFWRPPYCDSNSYHNGTNAERENDTAPVAAAAAAAAPVFPTPKLQQAQGVCNFCKTYGSLKQCAKCFGMFCEPCGDDKKCWCEEVVN